MDILNFKKIYIINQVVHICMLPIAGQTAGPNGLNFFLDTHWWPWGVLGFKKSNFNFKFFFKTFFFKFFSTGNAEPFS